jgi:Zn-dependent protease
MAIVFFIASLLGLPNIISILGIQINLWIAFFNLLPIGPLDGRKIIEWNPIIWGACTIPLIFIIFIL